jgi:acyl CoA:acetate/3-ketoacid CoA transferase alpha subunit/acyl CoA:acetate/3-ketoacid CoA transferase beta subunit
MNDALTAFIDTHFKLPVTDGEDKRCTPEQAIARHIEKGMALYVPCGAALLNPLIRRFWGQQPEFTLITTGITLQLHAMIHGGLVKKAVTSFAGHTYPSPRPCKVVQKAFLEGRVEFENWSIRTIVQRLLAGAIGLDFLPTRSLIGSSMAEENTADFKIIDEPFGGGGKIGLVRALRPDVALVHAAACDRSGNAIFTYPLIGDAFGAWAARKGVVVSTEKIVSSDYVRRHAHMVRIPSRAVLAVCEAPFGLHPYGVTPHGLSDYENANFPDYEFQTELMEATRSEETFSAWIGEWVLGCRNHEDYLAKLGTRRLLYLRGKAAADAWKTEILSESKQMDFTAPPNVLETLAVSGSRVITERCLQNDYDAMLAGIGLANLCAWLARHALEGRGREVDLLAEIGMSGYFPRPSDPTVFGFHHMHSSKFLNNIETALGYLVGGPTSHCMGILGAGQIDRYGNTNSTKIPGAAYLVGSGGANDVAATASESMVVMTAGKGRLVKSVPYITFPGDKIRTLVTDVGVFEKDEGQAPFTLSAYIPVDGTLNEEECLRSIKAKVGWKLETAPGVKRMDPPTEEELTILRLFDPRGFFIGS